jgi:hypothetical protein
VLVGGDVEPAEEEGETAFAGGIEAGEAECQSEGQSMVAAELGDGFEAAHARQHGDRGEVEERPQGMPAAARLAGIGKGSKDFLKGQRRRRHAHSPRSQGTNPRNRLPPYPNCLGSG